MQTSTAVVSKKKGNGAAASRKAATPPTPKADVIYTTRNYSIFKSINGNRNIIESRVLQVAEWIEANDLRVPIEVTQRFEVLDGQHRIEARKLLDLDVPYHVIHCTPQEALRIIQELNNRRVSWSATDWLESYCAQGNQNYLLLKQFLQTYRLPMGCVLPLLMAGLNKTDGGSYTSLFRSGQFEVKHLETAMDVAKKLSQLDGIFDGWKSQGFVRVVSRLMATPAFKWERFAQKVRANPTRMKKCSTADEYLDVIEKLYNYRVPENERVGLKYAK